MARKSTNAYSLKYAVYEYGIKESGEEGWLLSAVFILRIDAQLFLNEMIANERAEEEYIQIRQFAYPE